MAEIHDLSVTDASNTGRFPEGQAPSTVNDGARALEGMVARFYFDFAGGPAATLSGSTIQFTANRASLTLTGTTSNYIANLMIGFVMGANPNTGPVALNINSIGRIELRDSRGVSLSSSVLMAGANALAIKDGTNDYFRLLYPDLANGVDVVSAQTISGAKTFSALLAMSAQAINEAKGADISSVGGAPDIGFEIGDARPFGDRFFDLPPLDMLEDVAGID